MTIATDQAANASRHGLAGSGDTLGHAQVSGPSDVVGPEIAPDVMLAPQDSWCSHWGFSLARVELLHAATQLNVS
jgi:hypothetical protein